MNNIHGKEKSVPQAIIKPNQNQASKTKKMFYYIFLIVYLFGLPNFWIEVLNLPEKLRRIFDSFTKILNALVFIFILMEMTAFITQENLTEKQKSDIMVNSISHPIVYTYVFIMACNKDQVKSVLLALVVDLKKDHNDLEVERHMIKKSVSFLLALIFSCIVAIFLSTFDEYMHVVKTGAPFNVLITAWPHVEDKSMLANAARVICYILWWIFMSRLFAMYMVVISLTTCLSHQYKNLQSYFNSLNTIFEKEKVSQIEKEEKYEEALRVGIKLHVDTLRCTRQSQTICNGAFSGQIVINIVLLVLLMFQMLNSERTLVKAFATGFTASAVLISTGFFMWNAGDITIEASHLATAMYFSGWHNCQGQSNVRVRQLVVITMFNAQKPVVLKGLGIVALSYQSYLSIVKSSYSVFSVLY